jgi:hypothetical protein
LAALIGSAPMAKLRALGKRLSAPDGHNLVATLEFPSRCSRVPRARRGGQGRNIRYQTIATDRGRGIGRSKRA